MVGKLFENEILNNWGGFKVLANVEETTDDANLAIKYYDHGDDFIVVRMKDGRIFEYGLYVTRQGMPDYNMLNSPYYQNYFIRKPEMYLKWDNRSELANEMYFYIENRIKERNMFGNPGDKIRKEYSKLFAQKTFEHIIEYVEKTKSKGIRFEKNDHKRDIIEYLKKNDILTEENLKLLNDTKFDTMINGADGIAGKRDISDYGVSRIVGDGIDRIIINGKKKNPEKISMKHFMDEYGCDRFALSLNQFR